MKHVSGSLPIPELTANRVDTGVDAANQALADLEANKDLWVTLNIPTRVVILEEIQRDLSDLGQAWVNVSLQAKGVPAGGFAEGEEWAIYGCVVRLLRLLRQSLLSIHANGHPKLPGKPLTLNNGQVAVPIFPTSGLEKMLLLGMHAETWLEPGVTAENVFLNVPGMDGRPGGVALVLGAGNISAIPCADMLHKLFIEGEVVALKINPVNDYLGPLFEKGFAALIRRGFLRILYGGSALGAYLCSHPSVDTIHLTGSDKTFESVVFGPGDEGARKKTERTPRTTKPVTAELGCVNPVIVVPGVWTEKDMRRAALMLATWLYSNAGFTCLAPRLIIQHKNWPQRQAWLDAFGRVLADTQSRPAYYPGAQARHATFLEAHPEARLYSRNQNDYGISAEDNGITDTLPWTLVPDVDPHNTDDICFTTEAFCTLIAETALEADGATEFLRRVVEFANQNVWGTLAVTLLVPPNVESDEATAAALKRAIADLRYGTVCINVYTGFVYSLILPWGSFPGQQPYDIQSGIGFVNNPLMLNKPQKSVFFAPFRRIDPLTLHHRHVATFCKHYADFQAHPSMHNMLRLLGLAMVG
jgi:acyl-CoA reductase-like NAD-dependent aldehyde dehydrogenase